MQSQDLTDSQWERLRELVPGGRKGKRGPRSDGGSSSTRCFGWPVPALAGAICQSGTATSTRSRHGTIDGCEQAISTGSSMPSSRTLTLSGWPSMPPSFGPTLRLSGPGAQKGATPGPLAQGLRHQTLRCNRRARAAGSPDPGARSAERDGRGLRLDRGPASGGLCWPTAPMMPMATTTSSSTKARSRSSPQGQRASTSTATTRPCPRRATASNASSANSNSSDA